MTNLHKPVRRVSLATVREQGKARRIVVILKPPNLIAFRGAGCRREYTLTLEGCYTMAVRAYVASAVKDRKRARAAKRKARHLIGMTEPKPL